MVYFVGDLCVCVYNNSLVDPLYWIDAIVMERIDPRISGFNVYTIWIFDNDYDKAIQIEKMSS
jgi:hypothetical protein